MSILSGNPYYDRYDDINSDHRKAGYTRVLAIPGRAEQASEFNEIQSIAKDYISRLGDSLYRDGRIISGCEVNIKDNFITINKGKLFLSGLIRNTEEAKLAITGVGKEHLVATLETTIVTATQDSSLRDPAQAAENYNQVGANREKQVVSFSIISGDGVVGDNGAVVYNLKDGAIIKETKDDNYSFINDVLAKRTFDENGNYKVEGINLQSVPEDEGDKIRLYVSAGKAYIRGYDVVKPSMSSVLLNKSNITRNVTSETAYFKSSVTRYRLSNSPIARMQNFTTSILVTGERQYRGNVKGGQEALNHTPVQSIVSVYTKKGNGDKDVIYQAGRDYVLYSDQIDWSPAGSDAQEPNQGVTYYVDYIYNYSMSENTDYKIENNIEGSYIILQDSGAKPTENSLMYFTYDFTLARRDLILLDSNGELSVIEGSSDRFKDLITPYSGSTAYLELGYVDIYPQNALSAGVTEGSRLARVVNYDGVRLTQDNLLTMLRRINSLEDSIAALDMERTVEKGEETTSLMGYFTDSFMNIDKSDLSYVNDTINYSACIDYDRNELTTSATLGSVDMNVDDRSSDSFGTFGDIISAPYTAVLTLQQTMATGTMLVNPYASYGPLCKINLNPANDDWIDTEQVKVNNVTEDTKYTTTTKVYSHGFWSRSAIKNLRGYLRTERKETTTKDVEVTHNTSESVATSIYEYMREKDVEVEGVAFGANAKNIKGTFNGKPVSLEARNGSTQGTTFVSGGNTYKTVNANANGTVYCKFRVPANTPCGTAAFQMSATNTLGETHVGTANYTASGTLLTTTITNTTAITNHYKVLVEEDNLYANDPLAQSFIVDNVYDRNIIKLGLYFATKSTTRPVVVQVRNMVNGYPGEKVYAEVSVDPKDVKIPVDPNQPVVTEVTLNQPVYCYAKQYYCFVVLSDSNDYSMYYANMGDKLLGSQESVVVNPYATGVMFSSSNASTWTAHQGSDLKFDLYRSQYTGNGTIVFKNVSLNDITGVMLDAAYEVDSDSDSKNISSNKTGLRWYYRFTKHETSDVVSDWLSIDTLVFRDLNAYAKNVDLKAEITTDFSTSPFISRKRVALRTFIDSKKSTYISRSIGDTNFSNPYQGLKITYQVAQPKNTSIDIYYMDKVNGDWVKVVENSTEIQFKDLKTVKMVTLDEIKDVDDEFKQYTWNINKVNCMVQDSSSRGSKFFKVRIDLNTTVAFNRPRVKKLACIFRELEYKP
jgi:hypothetical protein